MKITFRGTGGTIHTPVFGCNCPACANARGSNNGRRPSTLLIETPEARIQIDAGDPNMALTLQPGELQAILLTHFHVDHVQGLFDLRWGSHPTLPVFHPDDPEGCADLLKNPGFLDFAFLVTPFKGFRFGNLMLVPLPLIHSRICMGYAIDDGVHKIAYLTDTCGLPEPTERFLGEWRPDALILDCTFPPQQFPENHNSLDMVQEIKQNLSLEEVWLTHIGHELDTWLLTNPLPDGLHIPNDGTILPL